MKKETLMRKILRILGLKKEKNSDVTKQDMCRKAVSFGVCPGSCEKCAWGKRVRFGQK